MWPFKKRIWKEVSREFLCRQMDPDYYGRVSAYFQIWAVTYEDLNSGKRKIEEVWTLD